jgi:UDP-N-acetyl-D-mannosaminuronic acid transferase (WecB/TagA/CpsF family)
LYLRDQLTFRPAIHCLGAALGFVTGDQKPIPRWADRLYLGWLLRLARNPPLYFRRFAVARELPGLIRSYGAELPAMRKVEGSEGKG